MLTKWKDETNKRKERHAGFVPYFFHFVILIQHARQNVYGVCIDGFLLSGQESRDDGERSFASYHTYLGE